MSSGQKLNPAKKFAKQNQAAVSRTKLKVTDMRQRALSRYMAVMNDRNRALAVVGDQLRKTVSLIHDKHEFAKNQLNQKTVTTEVHVRVNRSLEALEQFVRVLRETRVTSERLKDAIQDPAVSGTLFERARRASVSDLLQSVQKQLIQQTEFINVAAHELRTPIMPILANAELLQSVAEGGRSEEIEAIVRNALRLKHLAENILNVAAIDSGSLRLNEEGFDLNALIGEIVEDKKYNLENDTRIVFFSEVDNLVLEADKDRIAQVISNLLDNAIKFTSKGEILITAGRNESSILISVVDSGPGIDARLFPVLFSKFVGMSHKGTGLGLYICKSIIEAHGGAISARNNEEYGKPGSTFTLSLPLKHRPT